MAQQCEDSQETNPMNMSREQNCLSPVIVAAIW
eukprot:CAMPEP_0116849606 /NCGR_PEP_ID=MMETSP0418-20121206/15671_1 /TAXON_ID=1158023 /ORGANISM="Astrosyne radiata, Strain 13vi08-1A" /LENGTH=32 /DNA_ID= /DNA_START= /DNA_END= /DNA_ORIENTATION=